MSERTAPRPASTPVPAPPQTARWRYVLPGVAIGLPLGVGCCLLALPVGALVGGLLVHAGGWYGLAAMVTIALRRRMPRADPSAALPPELIRGFATLRQRLHLVLVVLLAGMLVLVALSIGGPSGGGAGLGFAWMLPADVLGPALIVTDWAWALNRHVAAHEREAVGRARMLVRLNATLSWVVWPAYTALALGIASGLVRL